jgi:hypothetical protein
MNKSSAADSKMVKTVCKIACQNMDIFDLCDVKSLGKI